MDKDKSREADRREIHWSYQAVMENGSDELKSIVSLITAGYSPGTNPQTGERYEIEGEEKEDAATNQ